MDAVNIPNTLGVPAVAARATVIDSVDTLQAVCRNAASGLTVLGEGSNVVPMPEVKTEIGLMRIKGFEVIAEESGRVVLDVAAGENWHACVMRCLDAGWFGLENLALIPGSVGAAPVQNIGAYGVELAAFVQSVDVVDAGGGRRTLSCEDCEFAYRDSVFKREPEWIIVGVRLSLSKAATPVTTYPDIQEELASRGVDEPSPQDVAAAVIAVRQRKLPDPADTPNAGSFFKNPLVSRERVDALKKTIPDLVTFPQAAGIKLSAAQLIDRGGWKNRHRGGVTVWPRQPLVLINPDHQSATDVLAFAADIRRDIAARYGVELELEPSLLS